MIEEDVFRLTIPLEQFEKVGEKLGDRLGDRLGKNRLRIFQLIKTNAKITIPQLASELNISTTAIENNIKILKDENYIRRIGSAKGGYWEVMDEHLGGTK